MYSIQHDHIVRAVAYPPDNSDLVATGGMEKKLRIFDLSELAANNPGSPATIPSSAGFFSSGLELSFSEASKYKIITAQIQLNPLVGSNVVI